MTAAQEIVERDSDDRTAPPVSESTAIIQMIERAAMDPRVNIDKMERLLAMQERVIERRARGAYAAALSEMQPKLPQVDRKGAIVIRSKTDETKVIQSTPYALWEDINTAIGPVLAAHGFALSFRIGTSEGKITVTGVLSHREGHQEETTITLTHDSTGSKNAVQAVGSSISYGKRYAAGALLNITSRAPGEADDDGKAGGGPMTVTDDQVDLLLTRLREVNADFPKFLAFFKIEELAALPAKRFEEAMATLDRKARKP